MLPNPAAFMPTVRAWSVDYTFMSPIIKQGPASNEIVDACNTQFRNSFQRCTFCSVASMKNIYVSEMISVNDVRLLINNPISSY